ncbi:MAG: winged helix-turn-helix domain-containing protein [Myxococcota bacterium]|jgi:restriction system protein|nr:winged helix-turn-helix domain-containing protein [Myxococcota bacterium]
MPVPSYDRFIEPILRVLARHPNGMLARDAHDAAADTLGLSLEDRAQILPSGAQAVYKNRAGWAHDRLKRAGLSSSTRRGYWKLTSAGERYVEQNPAPLSDAQVSQIAETDHRRRLRANALDESELLSENDTSASPDDRLEAALAEIRAKVAEELLETLSTVSPR